MTKEQNRPDFEPGATVKAAALELQAALDWDELNPCNIPKAAAARIAALNYPTPDDERQAAHLLRQMIPRIKKLLADFDYRGARLAAADMEERCQRLTYGKPTPSFQDQLRDGGMNRLLTADWSTTEAEGLRYFAKHGDRLGAVTASSAQLGDRIVARAEVREALAKRGYSAAQLKHWARNESIAVANEKTREEMARRGGPTLASI